MRDGLALSRLRRLLDPGVKDLPRDPCQRCGGSLTADHRHIANVATRQMLCVCPACHAATALAEERVVPRRYLRIAQTMISDEDWDAFDIPVGIAFFFHNSTLGRTVASYPSPAGAVESLLSPDAWERVLRPSRQMQGLSPDVEALLVRRTNEACECFVVPIDACYELAGRIRRRWSGFGGGPEVRDEIESFFGMLREKSEPAAS